MTASKQLWIGYRVYADGKKRRLTPGGKKVFGDTKRLWLLRRAKALGQTIEIKKYTPPTKKPAAPAVETPSRFSPHFTKAEFASKDGKPVPVHLRANAQRLAAALEQVRANLGDKPLVLLSVYRSPERNKAVGGARNSKHMSAEAADIDVPATLRATGKTRAQLMKAIEAVPTIHGIGVYPNGGVHVDVRADRRVFWSDWIRQ